MIYFSIVPYELIFYENSDAAKMIRTEIDYFGMKLEVMEGENNQYIINRIISSSPKDYLDPRIQPGNTIKK